LDAISAKQRFGISYWDAAILAAAKQLGCHTVYSEDLNHGQDYDGVRVVNPFLAATSPSTR
jgi:predicted nucleic acid-binding protein